MWKSLFCSLCRRRHSQILYRMSRTKSIIAIAREESSIWERRAPLNPLQVQQLVRSGINVIVQPSTRRAYTMDEYAQAGAVIQEDMSEATAIMSIKVLPVDSLLPDKTYSFFSHTIKAQEANMPLLDAVLDKRIRLMDYETMRNDKGQRVVAFGQYAGIAGMINILHGLGLRLLALGHHTPFMHIGMPHNYPSTSAAKAAVASVGREIQYGLLPSVLGPMVFVFTGTGNVSQGAQEVFKQLPVEMVESSQLQSVVRSGDSTQRIFGTIVKREDYLVRRDGGKFDKQECKDHPELYKSVFSTKIAPYMSVLINGLYWDARSPRLLTYSDAKRLLTHNNTTVSKPGEPHLPHRLLAICDISADLGGSLEFMTECTSIDNPFLIYNPFKDESVTGDMSASGVLMSSIDNMPAQVPREATDFFGSHLQPYVDEVLRLDGSEDFTKLSVSPTVKDALITYNGCLTPKYDYIKALRAAKEAKAAKAQNIVGPARKVLILGSGYVSAPVVEYLTRREKFGVTIASNVASDASQLASRYANTTHKHWTLASDSTSDSQLKEMVDEHDVVIRLVHDIEADAQLSVNIKDTALTQAASFDVDTDADAGIGFISIPALLPSWLHPAVAKVCVANGKHLVTCSYTSPEMQKLSSSAEAAGVTLLNEVGLDPGIDHMLAVRCFNDVKKKGGIIESFVSWCGGLPSPESSDNALRYKFSWSPRTVLGNLKNPAKYMRKGKLIEVPAGGWLMHCAEPVEIIPGFNLEGIPNRDSTVYAEKYGLTSVHTILRGTLRFLGHFNAVQALDEVGLLDDKEDARLDPSCSPLRWCDIMAMLVSRTDARGVDLKSSVYELLGRDLTKLNMLEELGLLSEETVLLKGTPLDTLTAYLEKSLAFEEGERDLVILQHNISIRWSESRKETKEITLVEYGDPKGFSAMSRLVGLPTAIATEMLLEGDISTTGVVEPLSSEIYDPILRKLNESGVSFKVVSHGQML